jgi:riboflavin biosynthesis pyrimidine reductase
VDAVLHESGAAGWGEAENCARVLIHAGGRLDAAGAFFKGQRVIVYSSGGLGRGTRAALEAMGNVRLHPRKAGGWRLSEVLEDLRARHGVRRAGLCGGPGLFRRLVAEGVLDELCVTWQPRILGGAMPGITGSDESFLARGVSLELVRLERMGDQCAARYRVHPGQQSRITG